MKPSAHEAKRIGVESVKPAHIPHRVEVVIRPPQPPADGEGPSGPSTNGELSPGGGDGETAPIVSGSAAEETSIIPVIGSEVVRRRPSTVVMVTSRQTAESSNSARMRACSRRTYSAELTSPIFSCRSAKTSHGISWYGSS